MSIFKTIRAIELDTNKKRNFGLKSAVLWGHSNNSNSCAPLLYISKPKHISQEDFDYMVSKIDIKFVNLTEE